MADARNAQSAKPPTGFAAYTGFLLRFHLGPWLALLALIAAAGVGGALIVSSMEEINPIQSTKLILVDPEDRRVDRDRRGDFLFVREICLSRDDTVEVIRTWSEVVPDDQVRPVMAGSVSFWEAKAGCRRLKIRQPVPKSLPPGQYVFDITLRKCSGFGQCESRRTEPIFLGLENGPGWPRQPVEPPDPTLTGSAEPIVLDEQSTPMPIPPTP